MTTQEVRDDALRLLRVLNRQEAMLGEGRSVVPSKVAPRAGLEVGSERYNAALRYLVDEGALVEEPDYGDPHRGQPPQPISYTFTSAALRMLGEREEGWQP
jgi:hypothetical protein